MLSRRLVVSFVLLLLLPAATVVWLGVQLLARDRGLESQQLRDRWESACDRLLYHPKLPAAPAEQAAGELEAGEFEAAEFQEAEGIEFDIHDYLRAAAPFRKIVASQNQAVRAGALLRSARNWRKAGADLDPAALHDLRQETIKTKVFAGIL